MTKYLRLHGEIGEGDSAAGAFIEALDSVPASQPVYLSINSPGGSYFDGLAIYKVVRRRGNVTVIVEALAASAASLICMAARKIIVSAGGMLMLHSPLATARGNPSEIELTLRTLRKIEADMASIYSQRAFDMSVEEALVLMRAESWLDGPTTRTVFRGVELDENRVAASISPEWLQGFRNTPLALTLEQHVKSTTPAKAPASAAERDAIRARRERRRKRLELHALLIKTDPAAAARQLKRRRLELTLVAARLRDRADAAAVAEAVERDAAEREAAKARQQQKYYDSWNNVPRGTR